MHEQSVTPLPFRPPFRWDALVAFHGARTIDGIDGFTDDVYKRGNVTIEHDGDALRLTAPKSIDIDDATIRARRMFDLDAEPIAIDEHLSRDRKLRPLIARHPGTRVPGAWEPFEIAVRAIVGQQISVRATTTIMNRLAPILTPQKLAEADIPGMPRARADTIRRLASAWPIEETIDRLTALRGIGPWTANYIAMRAFKHPDAFPEADLGLRKAATALGIERLRERAEKWRPYRAYAAVMLWETL